MSSLKNSKDKVNEKRVNANGTWRVKCFVGRRSQFYGFVLKCFIRETVILSHAAEIITFSG